MAEIRPGSILVVSAIIIFFLLSKIRRLNDMITFIADKLFVFLYFYIPISVISVLIVLYNNIKSIS